MILYYEKGIRGGITRAICHYAEDSNIYMSNYGKVKKVLALCILVLAISIDELYLLTSVVIMNCDTEGNDV